jgi:hypothetical protein
LTCCCFCRCSICGHSSPLTGFKIKLHICSVGS